jgi:hypothetical protein
METTFDYLRQFGPALAERILETQLRQLLFDQHSHTRFCEAARAIISNEQRKR